MQGQVGSKLAPAYMSQAYATYYLKMSDITSDPGSSDLIIFLEENMFTMNDGWLQVDNAYNGSGGYGSQATFPDLPGSYHNWGCGISFADGHAQIRVWKNSALLVPVKYGYIETSSTIPNSGNPIGATASDWRWFTSHCAARK